MVDRVPELRSALCWRRPFLTQRTAAFDAAALGVLAAAITRKPAPLALALPYLRHRPRPAQAAADAVGAAALAGGQRQDAASAALAGDDLRRREPPSRSRLSNATTRRG